ncbi:hypothetical protein [Kitasatospora sp. NRRL B-11411]|uniref:hypothetical protein n=1 Tax=Kitasatospora sp. NRRL B-11411 TaxID=1463822 RepID=UPI0004C45D7A|nr:hypothetical protein [Kitasatospora sp. NRRL B-11411]
MVTEHQHQKTAAKGLGLDLAEVDRAAANAGARVAAAGAMPWLNVNGKLLGHMVGTEYAPLDFVISTQIKAFLPHWALGSYPLLSGAAHGRPWMIARGRTDSGEWRGEAATVMAAVMVVMGALESGVSALGEYLGIDTTAALADMESTRMDFLYASVPFALPTAP